MPLSLVADTGLNVWALASVLTARTADPGAPAHPPYVRNGCSTHPLDEPSWEHK
ncbi:hypothetical protein [Streptomyces sp. McG3]|uniref:hypothetical protein n=1 Tax=Streptomyces sp. McG3 TaxID=2725483 RepID=UPI001BE8FB69|nr:hypothetical protein [Streptomyces sp. McG3]MBT2898813.1 hypothetical protein [Streptomyces sp. McG3]